MYRRHVFCFQQYNSFLPNASTGVTLYYEIPLLQQLPYNLKNLITSARQALDCLLLCLAFSQQNHTGLVHNINHSF